MSEKDLFKQLHRLNNIRPSAEYSGVSRLIITMSQKDKAFEFANEEMKLSVSALETITPSPEFTASSRSMILNHPRTIAQKVMRVFSPKNIARQAIGYSLSVGLAVALMAIVIGGADFRAVPGMDGELASQSERSIKDIDIHLENAQYFAISADKTRTALNDASRNSPAHVNPFVIENESSGFEYEDPSNPRIDDMLREATL